MCTQNQKRLNVKSDDKSFPNRVFPSSFLDYCRQKRNLQRHLSTRTLPSSRKRTRATTTITMTTTTTAATTTITTTKVDQNLNLTLHHRENCKESTQIHNKNNHNINTCTNGRRHIWRHLPHTLLQPQITTASTRAVPLRRHRRRQTPE